MGGLSVGLHFAAYPPDYDVDKNPIMEFWITVKPAPARTTLQAQTNLH
jgi:hypothetical protein